MTQLALDQQQLCDIQGHLFKLALKSGYDCPTFIRAFMNSRTAAALDDTYDRLQWAWSETERGLCLDTYTYLPDGRYPRQF